MLKEWREPSPLLIRAPIRLHVALVHFDSLIKINASESISDFMSG